MQKDETKHRIVAHWEACCDWLPVWEGMCFETMFIDVPLLGLGSKLQKLLQNGYTIDPIVSDSVDVEPADLPGDINEAIEALKIGELHSFTVIGNTLEAGFELRLQLLIEPWEDRLEAGFVDIDAIWWADSLFPADVDPRVRFEQFMVYVLKLQAEFGGPKGFIGQGSPEPRNPYCTWRVI